MIANYNEYIDDSLYSRFQQHLDNPEKRNPTKIGKAVTKDEFNREKK